MSPPQKNPLYLGDERTEKNGKAEKHIAIDWGVVEEQVTFSEALVFLSLFCSSIFSSRNRYQVLGSTSRGRHSTGIQTHKWSESWLLEGRLQSMTLISKLFLWFGEILLPLLTSLINVPKNRSSWRILRPVAFVGFCFLPRLKMLLWNTLLRRKQK